jgi:transcriptional regulator with XRE-family HTH domain
LKTTEAGLIINKVKTKTGMSNKQIGKIFGFHENTIYAWTSGRSRPFYDDIMMIIDYFGLSISEIRRELANDNTEIS